MNTFWAVKYTTFLWSLGWKSVKAHNADDDLSCYN